ncbi:bifunctional diguanylate cyclase/phosphodiesterase [Glaciecola sp. 33A]|uniref:bifunctional diguanylate cyclase/phosphodiesterase n=1 Tax=Glaciecola sp. 33A TaxID=2057807 RepID=UPI000C345FC5|nr:bifunctional diguanylate cyclase/phosphodiesterase [Glaciecola sp. 33A]PKI01453.1 GGDEF domain-containing protein [Glaciecola sp. 33A]
MQQSLNQRINNLIIGVVVLTTLVLVLFVWKSTSEQAASRLKNDLAVARNVLTQVLQNRHEQLTSSVSVLTNDFGFKDAVASRDKRTIDSALSNQGERINADLMALFSLDAITITSVPELITAQTPFIYPELIDSAQLNGNSTSILSLDDKLYQVLFSNVKAPRSIAVALMGFEIDQALIEQLKQITQLETTVIVYIDGNNAYQISTLKPDQYSQNIQIENTDALFLPLLAYSSDSKLISTSFNLLKKERLKIDIMLSNDIKTVFSDFISLQTSIGLIAIIAVIMAIFLGALFSRKLVKPIQSLTIHAKNISAGIYDEKIDVDWHSSELSMLSHAFDTMQDNVKDREHKVIYQAQHDVLTTLYNRNHAETLLSKKFNRQESFQAIGINIFGFRGVNDTFGYHNGDRCLQELAQRVINLGGLSARLTGGELLWIPDHILTEDELIQLKNRLDGHVISGDLSIPMTVAIGVINCPLETHSPSELFRRMNIVIDEAQMTRQFILHFSAELEEKYTRRLSIITELKKELSNTQGELALFYQPKLDLTHKKVSSVEALIRWNNAKLGFVSPEDFIEVAEHAGFIGEVTAWVYQQAIHDIQSFRAQGIEVNVAINISAQDVMNPELLPNIMSLLHAYELPTCVLSFEMTEGQLVKDLGKAVQQLALMREAGFKIAIDDFGTGYSSLSYLSRLPADILKIDKSFILKLNELASDQNIVKSVIQLGHQFNMEIVAEGVENQESLNLLIDYGCEWAQGYHICRPVNAASFVQWFQDYQY